MSKVIYNFQIGQYSVLKLDEIPEKKYSKFRINGKEFEPVPIYDMPQCIAIASTEDFFGKIVEFI
ncbi:MAG: hypothetical protein K6G88_11300 [Lachnospiraceae bacterium]|nr:hypothetical protein [Lachnospiraceae bacterium]